jgi:methionyl-tRNA synthetase
MVNRYNADLANNLGNLLSRVATVVAKKCGGTGPAPRPDSPLAAVAAEVLHETTRAWANVQPSVALEATWRLIREANAHLEANEPWKAEPGPEVDAVMGDALEVLRIVAILASPAVPRSTAEVWRRIGLSGAPDEQRLPGAAAWGGYPGGLPVEKGDPLFPRVRVDA